MAAPTIITRTISAAAENAISLGNGAFARMISLPINWTTMRIGIRSHMTNSGGNLGSTPRFAFGLCKGTTNIFGSATVDHFAGYISTSAAWLLQGGPFYGAVTGAPCKKVNTTLTVGSDFSVNAVYPCNAAASGADRVLHFLDITKGSPNYSFKLFTQNSGTIADVSAATFLSQIQLATPSLTNHALSTAQTLAVDESVNGTFDSINFFWDQPTCNFEICDVGVVQMA